jgi:hypothetical protein
MNRHADDITRNERLEIEARRLLDLWENYANPKKGKGVGVRYAKEVVFDEEVRASAFELGLIGSPRHQQTAHKGEKFAVGSKAWFSKLKPDSKKLLPSWVIEAIYFRFDTDISAARLMRGRVVDRFDFFTPGALDLRRVSNRPDDAGRDLCQATLPLLVLKDTQQRVLRTNGAELGVVQAWLDEATIEVSGGGGNVENTVATVLAGESGPRGTAARYDLTLISGNRPAAQWSLRAHVLGEPIRSAALTGLHLCDLRLGPDETASLVATGNEACFQFKFIQGQAPAGDMDSVRSQVFAQILKQRRGAQMLQKVVSQGSGDAEDGAPDSVGAGKAPRDVTLSRQYAGPPK